VIIYRTRIDEGGEINCFIEGALPPGEALFLCGRVVIRAKMEMDRSFDVLEMPAP
jgi:hypothetical protein